MTQLRFAEVGKRFGDRWIVRRVDWAVEAGDRWGVVGRNGVGKTTLFRLITGENDASEGEIWRHPDIRFSLLRQQREEQGDVTVGQAAREPFADLLALEARIAQEASALADVDTASPEGERLLALYDRHLEEFRRRGGYELHARAEAALEGLGFPSDTWARPVRALSGGELGRLRLAQTLLAEPDVLLLDEPTNHLDLRSTEWLEGFLRGYSGTVVVVSHDRVFLERVADHILHLEGGTAQPYAGGWESFLTQREERRLAQTREWEKQQTQIARTEDFIRRNLAGQKTKQAKSRRTLLSRMDRIDRPGDEGRSMALRFGDAQRSGGTVLRVDGVSCGYGERVLFSPFSAEVSREERVALVGANGSGKTTLMRVLAGDAPATTGGVILGSGVRAAYYRQDLGGLDPDLRIREAVNAAAPTLPLPQLRDHLARFLFTGDDWESRVGDLSGGEKARVALARITLQRVNLLLLDEPTNHLDLESREALEEALLDFDGTVILVSHDRALLGALATRVWNVEEGRVQDLAIGFDEWMEARAGAPASQAAAKTAAAAPTRPNQSTASGLSKNEIRRREREMQQAEAQIGEAEAHLAAVEARLADPALYGAGTDPAEVQRLSEERERTAARIAELYAVWEQAGEALVAV